MSQLRFLVFLLLLIVGVLFWLRSNLPEEAPDRLAEPAFLQIKDATIYGFAPDGRAEKSLASKEVLHYQNERGTHFLQPVFNSVRDNKTTSLYADYGIESQDKTVIDLQNVRGESLDAKGRKNTLKTESARYLVQEKLALTDKEVFITTPNSTTTGLGAEWKLGDNIFILKKNVRSSYVQSPSK